MGGGDYRTEAENLHYVRCTRRRRNFQFKPYLFAAEEPDLAVQANSVFLPKSRNGRFQMFRFVTSQLLLSKTNPFPVAGLEEVTRAIATCQSYQATIHDRLQKNQV